MKLRNCLILLVSVLLAATVSAADVYKVDPNHARVGFVAKHLLINKVRGEFKEFTASIHYDPNDITKSSFSGVIQAASITTGVEARDNDLKSANFLEVAKYPEIIFQSTAIEKRGDGYVAKGTLTIHGVSKQIELPFTIEGPIQDLRGDKRIGIDAEMTLNRFDYGVSWDKTLDSGGLVVGKEIKVEISAELIQQKAS